MLENLAIQSKQAEATYLKIQGAIEIIESMIQEEKDSKDPKKESKKVS